MKMTYARCTFRYSLCVEVIMMATHLTVKEVFSPMLSLLQKEKLMTRHCLVMYTLMMLTSGQCQCHQKVSRRHCFTSFQMILLFMKQFYQILGHNILVTAIHEIGHSLGLEHSRKKGSIMWPWSSKEFSKGNFPRLAYDDILAIQLLYGGKQKSMSSIYTPSLKISVQSALFLFSFALTVLFFF